MRLRHDNTAQEKLNNSSFYIKDFPVYLNEDYVLEIGSGKGEMISQLAYLNPNIKYIAIEKYPTVALKILKKINELNLKNLFIITEDAIKLPEILKGKVSTIWLTFSDPWPKNAHEKRRLTYKTYLNLYKDLLSEKGQLFFKTDNDKLFNFSIDSLKENNWEIMFLTNDLHNSKYNESNIKTGYEIKWSEKGKNINFLITKPLK
ncbi:tRNA (guanosine(46)-N7)-methyltransferase TrmB [Mycoplasmopsis felis]|uniref:tRNA (guanosine(46)-N7)-methyltransferase TrmB n=1 Tax=Mycoplasmopsis felis TaxID=33923 RepID=UPI002AF6B6ED|nr:tRNA (guanosine(46)-N7)-methyltransferase TrmB [Mycoplasmopsis felis]WQQ02038.1 tRNA (guanosine(46)-N7)-methyltransferase TrmB [Mycoplasmopsis felis]WQQ06613.1 tRNA (guanosine(46)-N7)-methyltransferase TrmB [Mycoplasmopsis felis]WQQ07449.1 tRNA (guanosine(46)-N7)-methyltransferase TrmB [Mycoplasmopsis felis]WQQ08428.1 tRNA (guanosine(46)-N7)-methyltransferase TrmB [Mycoplasmopsis felis]WQQ10549.1 tRNA (guanosine(46)-N7)-methyltransferase TrmB [Mycoplasmopsis felis]